MEALSMREAHHRSAGLLSRLFPEKSIIVRSDSRFHCLRLSCRGQAALAAAALVIGAWTMTATGMLALEAFEDSASEHEIAAVAAHYDARLSAAAAARDAAAAAHAEAEARAQAALAQLRERHDAMTAAVGAQRALDAQVATLSAANAALLAERDAAQTQALALAQRSAALEAEAQAIEAERADLAETLHRIAGALNATVLARDDAEATAEQVVGALGALEADVSQQRDRQAQLLAQIEKAATLSIAPLESMLKAAGVNIDSVLEQLRRETEAAGGPFIPAGPEDALEPEEEARASAVIEDLQTVRLLRTAAAKMPFGAPVAGPRFTSRFGLRADPLNRRRARHEGLDMAGPRGAAVSTAADGVVSFAGVQRGYGKVVKIRHAFGFETVYAHLNAIRVTAGQRVARGARIGDLGSTGRSTGPHLHYEVRVNGNPVNPMKFIEAASNVL
ncbi:MAG: peptidase M23 [Rhodobacterales bacterium CG_4_9_14_3_um_filter_71_31]|nr:MAG: peptidase M23 [Rhodobacterales bacterium CG_4_9_14_3_um_filter_71_31]